MTADTGLDLSTEAVERLVFEYTSADENPERLVATLRALAAERDALRAERDNLLRHLADEATARGEAEGRLAASELAGVVDGWKRRAEKAERGLAALLAVARAAQYAHDRGWIESGDAGDPLIEALDALPPGMLDHPSD